MYCERCNKNFSMNSKFCDNCGDSLKEKAIEVKNKTKKKTKKKKKRTGLIITLVILGIVLVIGSTIFFVLSIINFVDKMGAIEYIELGNDKIPTIYMYDKNIQIDEYNKNIDNTEVEVEITYYDDLSHSNTIDKYIDFLEEKGFTYIENEYDDYYLVKESKDNGKVIIIEIEKDYYYDEYDITYKKITGDISNYIKKVTYKRVGQEKYGYIDIDDTWNINLSNNEFLQYEGKTGNLFLSYAELTNNDIDLKEYVNDIYTSLIEEEVDIELIEVTVDGYKGYQLFGYDQDSGLYTASWYFIDNDNIMHYVELDAREKNSEIFSKIKSYSVLK